MLRRASSPPLLLLLLARTTRLPLLVGSCRAFSRSSIEHSAVVQQTEPGINVARHTDQLCTVSSVPTTVQLYSAMCSEAVILW